MFNLLFICSGNVNRSAAAEAIAKQYIKSKGISNLNIESAGLVTPTIDCMAPEMSAALRVMGYNNINHRPRLLKDVSNEPNLVLSMENKHVDWALEIMPSLEGRILTLNDYVNKTKEVPDPHYLIKKRSFAYPYISSLYLMFNCADECDSYGIIKVHRSIAKQIQKYINSMFDKMKKEGIVNY